MKKEIYELLNKKLNDLSLAMNGGKGSGNFGHSGRPGEVGGSAPSGSSSNNMDEEIRKELEGIRAEKKKKYDRIDNLPEVEGKTKVTDAIKQDGLDKHGMSDEELAVKLSEEYYGSDYISNDFLEDVQYHIDQIYQEQKSMLRELEDEFLSGPAKTKSQYHHSDASRKCKDEYADIYTALSDHAEWIGDSGNFASGLGAKDYEKLADKLATEGDKSREYDFKTQADLVSNIKRLKKELESYGVYDGSKSSDMLDEFLDKYDLEKNSITLNGGKGSGNFGHSGRPGEVGGSSPSGSTSSSGQDKTAEKELKKEIKVKSKEYDQLFDKLLDASRDTNNKNVSAIKKLIRQFDDNTKIWNLEPEDQPAEYDRRVKEIKKILAESKKSKSEGLSLRGKSLYEKVHMIEPGDEVHIKPQDNLPNFDKKIKVDYVQDGTIHYGASETSDGYTYPAWAIKDITKIVRKKKNSIYAELFKRLDNLEKALNGGKGSGNFGHAGRPGEVGGSAPAGVSAASVHVPRQQTNPQTKRTPHDTGERSGGIQIEGNSPEALINLSDSPRSLSECTGAGSKYSDGEIRVGYEVKTESPFTIDKDSQDALEKTWGEMDNNREQDRELGKKRGALITGQGYKSADGWDLRDWSSESDVMSSNMPDDKKAQWKKLKDESGKLSEKWRELDKKCDSILENAKHTPRNLGARGAILVTGLAKGISEYLGQRSDGAGEGSFNDRTRWHIDNQSRYHKAFIEALKHPQNYSEASFNAIRDNSAKLAKSQATYLKRVENSINEPNFMGSKEFSNVASTIKKMSWEDAFLDRYRSPDEYVTFEGGIPKIHKK